MMARDMKKDGLGSIYDKLGMNKEDLAAGALASTRETLDLVKLFYEQDAQARAMFLQLTENFFELDHHSRKLVAELATSLGAKKQ